MRGNQRVREAIMAIRIIGKNPETMSELYDAINARAFDREAFADYLANYRPPWRRAEND